MNNNDKNKVKHKLGIKSLFIPLYNKYAIERYLEEQAEKGWLVDKINPFGIIFRSAPPQKLNISVNYFPKDSFYETKPTDAHGEYEDFCSRAGRENLACYGPLNVFCTKDEDAVPIDTDMAFEVEAISKIVKRNYFPLYTLFLLNAAIHLFWFCIAFPFNYVHMLSYNAGLLKMGGTALLIAFSLWDVIAYKRWLAKARAAAGINSSYGLKRKTDLVPASTFLVSYLMFSGVFSPEVKYSVLLSIVLSLAFILALTAIIGGVYVWLQKHPSRRMSYVGVLAIITVALLILILVLLISYRFDFERKKPAYTYELNGIPYSVYKDEIPLKAEDLFDISDNQYSYIMHRRSESMLMGYMEASQRDTSPDSDNPGIYYCVYAVKTPMLYDSCVKLALESAFYDYGNRPLKYGRAVDENDKDISQVSASDEDAASWGAKAAYRIILDGEAIPRYVICYDRTVVEVDFNVPAPAGVDADDFEFEPSDEQKAIIAKKLAN